MRIHTNTCTHPSTHTHPAGTCHSLSLSLSLFLPLSLFLCLTLTLTLTLNWQLTTLKRLRNVLRLIMELTVTRRDVATVDPGGFNRVFGRTRFEFGILKHKAMYDFTAQVVGDLNFKKGDVSFQS